MGRKVIGIPGFYYKAHTMQSCSSAPLPACSRRIKPPSLPSWLIASCHPAPPAGSVHHAQGAAQERGAVHRGVHAETQPLHRL